MPGVIPAHILVHVAVPLVYGEDEEGTVDWAEGEPGGGPEPSPGDAFVCVVFLPGPGGSVPNEYRPKTIRTPTLLCNPSRNARRPAAPPFPEVADDQTAIILGQDDELLITAPELAPWTGGETVRWQVSGGVQAFGRPGTVMGLLASISQVKD